MLISSETRGEQGLTTGFTNKLLSYGYGAETACSRWTLGVEVVSTTLVVTGTLQPTLKWKNRANQAVTYVPPGGLTLLTVGRTQWGYTMDGHPNQPPDAYVYLDMAIVGLVGLGAAFTFNWWSILEIFSPSDPLD